MQVNTGSTNTYTASSPGEERSILSLYSTPPIDRVSLEHFEQTALDRLTVLNAFLNEQRQQPDNDHFRSLLKSKNLDDPENDRLSHFTLRLALCNNEEWRRWFCRAEVALFRSRFQTASPADHARFFVDNSIPMERVTDPDIIEEVVSLNRKKDAGHDVFQMPFINALDLVGKRKVIVRDGLALVPNREMLTIVCARFRSELSANLAATFRASHQMNLKWDDRIKPLLASIQSNKLMDRSYKPLALGSQFDASSIEKLAPQSFPPCMMNMFQSLKTDRHLKHEGRRQFGLFLKGVGLSMEESLKFWRESFAGRVPRDKFEKQYAYNIRYDYGKEGKRTDWSPMGCGSIINGSVPGAGQQHGCPFKHMDRNTLHQKLSRTQFPVGSGISAQEILDKASDGHFQVACQRYFCGMHPGALPNDVGNHPNAYFDESRKYHDAKLSSNSSEMVE